MTYVILYRSLFTGSVSVLVSPLKLLRKTGKGRLILKTFVLRLSLVRDYWRDTAFPAFLIERLFTRGR